jgi:hypothetical protein
MTICRQALLSFPLEELVVRLASFRNYQTRFCPSTSLCGARSVLDRSHVHLSLNSPPSQHDSSHAIARWT